MSRYIDVNDLIERFAVLTKLLWLDSVEEAEIVSLIGNSPSIDIVRCKECKYYDKFPTWSACTYWSGDPYEQASVNADDFCSYGERREP